MLQSLKKRKIPLNIIALISFIAWWFPLPAYAQPAMVQTDITKATLFSDTTHIEPGKPFRIGLLLESMPGWHSYWENPGDAGMATSLEVTAPEGYKASKIDWPVPQLMEEGTLTTFAYKERVFLPVTIMPPDTIAPDATIEVKANWLICKDICIPESADLSIILSKDAMVDEQAADLFSTHDANAPRIITSPIHYAATDEKHITLELPNDVGNAPRSDAHFFPRQEGLFEYNTKQRLQSNNGKYLLTIATSGKPLPALSGLLTVTDEKGTQHAFDITLTPGSISTSSTPNMLWLPVVLLLAMAGGLVLNLMPCVLPVLSLKALAVAKKTGKSRRDIIGLGIAYTLGIVLSFIVIAIALLTLRQGGEAIGWGFQMQSPPFVGFLIYLLFLVGLSLSGLFHLPVLLGNASAGTDDSTIRGSFFTGILAVLVATPCTAPFMATAVGAALALPIWQCMLIFAALGLGLALPFLLISLFPRLLAFLPKPGAWMETFQQFLAFPMYASVIWLLWVLTLQTGANGMLVTLCGLLGITIIVWAKKLFTHGKRYGVTAIVLFAMLLTLSLPMLAKLEQGSGMADTHAAKEMDSTSYSKEALRALRDAGKPVFVDATAAWCLTCQVNARVAIHTQRTMAAFKEHGVTLMIADWTRRNPEITELLDSFGYKGVPLYIYYPAKGEPVILPQLLTEDIVINAIQQ